MPQRADCQFSFRMLFPRGGEGETVALLGEWICLQSGVYLNISANTVQSVVYSYGDRRSHSTSRCRLDIHFATERVGSGTGAGLQFELALGSFGFSRSASLLLAIY